MFEVVLFLYQKEKERKRSWQACGLTARANAGRYHAKPDEAPLPMLPSAAPFIGSLWEPPCLPKPSSYR